MTRGASGGGEGEQDEARCRQQLSGGAAAAQHDVGGLNSVCMEGREVVGKAHSCAING